jgi:hypothetical protein
MTTSVIASLHVDVYSEEALQILKSMEAAHLIGIAEEEVDDAQKVRLNKIKDLYGSITKEQGDNECNSKCRTCFGLRLPVFQRGMYQRQISNSTFNLAAMH